MLINILKEQGFSEREANIYLSCLQLNTAPASSIARHAGEKRVTGYTLLKELIKKGAIQETIKNKIRYYNTVHLEQIIANQKQKIEQLEKALPEFLALMNTNIKKPKIYFFEGKEGLKNIYNEIVTIQIETQEKDPIISFVGTTEMDKEFEERLISDFIPRDISIRKQKKNTKVIIFDEKTSYAKFNKKYYDTLVIKGTTRNMTNEIIAYGEKVAILMYKTDEMSGVIIESKNMNNMFRNVFDLLWKAYK